MDNRWRSPGIAEVTLQAYARRHGGLEESRGERCRARIKPIALTIFCTIVIALAVYWLIVGPIYENLKAHGSDSSAASSASSSSSRDCNR